MTETRPSLYKLPVVTRFRWPPLTPLIITFPTMVSAQGCNNTQTDHLRSSHCLAVKESVACCCQDCQQSLHMPKLKAKLGLCCIHCKRQIAWLKNGVLRQKFRQSCCFAGWPNRQSSLQHLPLAHAQELPCKRSFGSRTDLPRPKPVRSSQQTSARSGFSRGCHTSLSKLSRPDMKDQGACSSLR